MNLRGIGANRTLVLVDGRRAQPANASLVVDLNTIPSAAIERVETITGGASAVYGADALAGVVNFVLRDDFEGVEMDFQTGVTAEGDGEETRFTTLLGVNGESGDSNVMLGVEWYNREAVCQRDREFYRNGWADRTNQTGGFLERDRILAGSGDGQHEQPTATPPFCAQPPDAGGRQRPVRAVRYRPGHRRRRRRNLLPAGRPAVHALRGINYNGPIMSYDVNGDGFSGVHRQPNGSLQQVNTEALAATPPERRSVFGRATFDMNDNLTAFAQANYSNIEVDHARRLSRPRSRSGRRRCRTTGCARCRRVCKRCSIRPAARRPEPWNMFRGIDFMGGAAGSRRRRPTPTSSWPASRAAFTNRDWTWEAYVSTGETEHPDVLRRPAVAAALPVPRGSAELGRGRVHPRPQLRRDCAHGLPMFATVDPDPGCIEAIESKTRALWDLTQNIVEANLQGKIADMRNGELRFAAGVATARTSSGTSRAASTTTSRSSSSRSASSCRTTRPAATEVSELYGELLIPATERLDLELGYRYSDYDRAGGVDTWKTLVDWSATECVRFRGGYQFATREPNTEELFAGPRLNTVVDFIYGDPCQASTTRLGVTCASNPNRLRRTEPLPAAIINRSDTNSGNDGQSAFDTNSGSTYGPAGPGRLRAARPAVLPVRERGAAGQPERHRRGGEDLDPRRGVQRRPAASRTSRPRSTSTTSRSRT